MEKIENKDEIWEKELHLIRKGNILNTIGVMRAAKIHGGVLEKHIFDQLVYWNYMKLYYDPEVNAKISAVWEKAKIDLKKLGMLDEERTTEDIIYLLNKKTVQV